MSRPYKRLKNVTIFNTGDLRSNFTVRLDIPFPVHEICLKSYSFNDLNTNADNTYMYLLSSNLVNGPLMSFPNNNNLIAEGTNVTSFCHAQFEGPRLPIQGQYDFVFTLINNDPSVEGVTANFNSIVALHFDFIEYH